MLLVLSIAGAVASAVEMALLYHPTANTTRLYFGTDTHAQSILVGSVLACSMTLIQMRRGNEGMAPTAASPPSRCGSGSPRVRRVCRDPLAHLHARGSRPRSTIGAGSCSRPCRRRPSSPPRCAYPAARSPPRLSLRPLVWIGTISYGAYLWHYPVFVYMDSARTGASGLSLLAIRSACTFALAAASYYLVERPVMYGTFWRSLKAAVPAIVLMVGTVAVVVAGTVAPATAAVRVKVNDVMPIAERQALTASKAFTTHPVKFLLVGDSLAFTLAVGLNVDIVNRYGVRLIDKTVLGCDLDDLRAIADGNITYPVSPCTAWRTLWSDQVAQYRPDVVGLLIGRWDITDHLDNGTVVSIGQPAWDEHLTQEINQAVSIFSEHGAKVVLFTMPFIDPPQTAPDGAIYPENDPVRVSEFNQILTSVAKRRSKVVTVIDLNKVLDPHGNFQSVIDGVTVRWADGIHISKPGGEWLQPAILPTVARLGLADRASRAPR